METKSKLIGLMFLSLLGSHAAIAASSSRGGATQSSYTATCRFPYPLDTYDQCDEFSSAGSEAEECARNQALVDCRNESNSDCVSEGATYEQIVSTEFVGYKACEATVHIHGYRVTN